MKVRCAVDAQNALGEGCLWEAEQNRLWWVDIEGRAIHRLTPTSGKNERWTLPGRPGSLALRATLTPTVIAAIEDGFARVTLGVDGAAEIDWIARPEQGRADVRMNDGRVGPEGFFWAGSMSEAQPRRADGSLYRLNPDGTVAAAVSGVAISNSTCFSPDGRTMYFADTPRRQIWAFDLAADGQTLSNRRMFVETPEGAHPDGACVDSEGGLWSAQWGAARVVRYLPDGREDAIVALPVSQPSCVCFGGDDLTTLYVTSARVGLSAGQLAREPQAGGVFAVDLDGRIRGLPERRFAG